MQTTAATQGARFPHRAGDATVATCTDSIEQKKNRPPSKITIRTAGEARMKTIGLLIPALFALVTFPSHAAIITNTYEVTASGFFVGGLTPCPNVTIPTDP